MTTLTKCLLAAAVVSVAATGTVRAETSDAAVVEHHPFAAVAAQFGAGLDYVNRTAVQPAATYMGETAVQVGSGTVDIALSSMDVIGDGANSVWNTVVSVPGIPGRAMEGFVTGLQSGHFKEFAHLVDETGFAIADVKVGVGLIPELGMEFKHVRDLSPDELADAEIAIEEYTTGPDAKGGYLEAAILRSLVEAGKRAGDFDLNTVDIHLFPLPGLTLKFDPFDYEEHKALKLGEVLKRTEEGARADMRLEARTIELEARELEIEAREAELEERMAIVERAVAALLAGQPDSLSDDDDATQ